MNEEALEKARETFDRLRYAEGDPLTAAINTYMEGLVRPIEKLRGSDAEGQVLAFKGEAKDLLDYIGDGMFMYGHGGFASIEAMEKTYSHFILLSDLLPQPKEG